MLASAQSGKHQTVCMPASAAAVEVCSSASVPSGTACVSASAVSGRRHSVWNAVSAHSGKRHSVCMQTSATRDAGLLALSASLSVVCRRVRDGWGSVLDLFAFLPRAFIWAICSWSCANVFCIALSSPSLSSSLAALSVGGFGAGLGGSAAAGLLLRGDSSSDAHHRSRGGSSSKKYLYVHEFASPDMPV